jgi:hypothetical protein
VQTARAVDEVDQAAVVVADVVALHSFGALWHVGHERRDLAGRVRIGDVDDAQPVREPGDRNFGTADFLARLESEDNLFPDIDYRIYAA